MTRPDDPFIIALDMNERGRLMALAEALRGEVETVKIGLEAFIRMGPEVVTALSDMGYRVFVDLKLHDIPNTVRGAVRALVHLGAFMITVHASGGRAMLEAAVEAASEEAEAAHLDVPIILGVTLLTSLDDGDAAEIGWQGGAAQTTASLARLGWECGLRGIVASAKEAQALREELGPGAIIVTPGIRGAGSQRQDQARTASPREALSAGADYLVVGRPITGASDPVKALRELREEA